MKDIEQFRKLYLADLGKIVNYGGNDRPRVRHVGNWERLPSKIYLDKKHDDYLNPETLYEDYNVWIWSDTDFFHKNIIDFSMRPYGNVDEMNEQMILNHNEYVQPDDVSIWVGDVGFGNDTKINTIVTNVMGTRY